MLARKNNGMVIGRQPRHLFNEGLLKPVKKCLTLMPVENHVFVHVVIKIGLKKGDQFAVVWISRNLG